MNRRQSIRATGQLTGALAMAPSALALFFQRCEQIKKEGISWTPEFISEELSKTLSHVVDLIIPANEDSPSATDALVHVFIDVFVKDCYTTDEQGLFVSGLKELAGSGFNDLSEAEQALKLETLEKENWNGDHFIRRVKHLTLLGYFSSKDGATKAAEYVYAHGAYEGCVDIDQSQKVYAL